MWIYVDDNAEWIVWPCLGESERLSTIEVFLYLYVLILQMYGGGWKGPIFVLISAHALFCLATATTCISRSKLPILFSVVSVNGLLTQVLVCATTKPLLILSSFQ